jgi:hypothetical protein
MAGAQSESESGMSVEGRFAGRWIGESMRESAQQVVIWRIVESSSYVFVYPTDESGNEPSGYFSGVVAADGLTFWLNDSNHGASHARILDVDHFVMTRWDRSTQPACDVVFSRPGLPELSARAVWEHCRES